MTQAEIAGAVQAILIRHFSIQTATSKFDFQVLDAEELGGEHTSERLIKEAVGDILAANRIDNF